MNLLFVKDKMRRTRLAWKGGSNVRKGGSGYVPYLPDCWKEALDFSDPLHQREDRTSFFCDLCKQQMSSKAAFVTHCNSAFHKEKEGSMNKMVSEHEWICHTCEKPFPSKVSLDQHCLLVRHQPMYRIEGMSGQKDEAKIGGQGQEEKEQAVEKKMLLSFGDLKPPYFCEVCRVDCLNNSSFKSHCESWKHKAAVNRHTRDEEGGSKRKGEDIAATHEKKILEGDVKPGNENNKSSSAIVKSNEYFCDICDVHIPCRDNFMDHLNGKKHRKHVSCMRVPYCCIFCDIKFATEKDFNEHYRSEEHICQASRVVNDKDMKIGVDATSKGKTDIKREPGIDRERDSREERDGSRSRRKRGDSREKDRFQRRGRTDERNKGDQLQRGGPSRTSSSGRELKGRKRSRDPEVSTERYASENKRKHKDGADKEGRSRREYRRERSASPERSRSSRSLSNEKRHKLSKEKNEKFEEKTIGKETESTGNDGTEEIGSEGERKVEIKDVGDKEEVGDLREKLNRGINIVITKKIKNEEEQDEKETDPDNQLHDDLDLEKDEEIILKHHKADLVLREQLLKEHTMEILKYKDAEQEYRRLFLEEDYLRNRLNLFRDGDPRKDNDAADLERIQRAIRDVREELDIRDVMIQEKERYLIVLKNRIEERTKIIAKAEKDSSMLEMEASSKPTVQYMDSVSPNLVVKVEDNTPIKDKDVPRSIEGKEQADQTANEDGDLRDEIERERILRKLAPGMAGLDINIRKQIVDALLTSEIPRNELMRFTGDVGSDKASDYSTSYGMSVSSSRPEKQESPLGALHSREIPPEGFSTKEQALRRREIPPEGLSTKKQALHSREIPPESFSTKKQALHSREIPPEGLSTKKQALHSRETPVESFSTKKQALHSREIPPEGLSTKKQALHSRGKPEELRSSEAQSEYLYKQESGTETRNLYAPKATDGSSIRKTRKQENEYGAVGGHSALETDDIEQEWRKREEELRRREEELRKREEELLERERQRRSGVQEKWSGEHTTSGKKDQFYGSSKSSSKPLLPKEDGRGSFDEKGKWTRKETEQDNGISDQSLKRFSPRARRDSSLHNKPSSPESFATRKRSRPRSSSPSAAGRRKQSDSRKGNFWKRDHAGKKSVDVAKERVAVGKLKEVEPNQQLESKELSKSFEYGTQYLGGLRDVSGLKSARPKMETKRMDMPFVGSALKEEKKVPDSNRSRKDSTSGSGRREQFALWKSILPASEVSSNTKKGIEKTKDDIWDTAFGTGEEEPVDKVAMDIFSDLEVDSDYLKGRLHVSRSKVLSKPIVRNVPIAQGGTQNVSRVNTMGAPQIRPSSDSPGTHTFSGSSSGSGEVLKQPLIKTEELIEGTRLSEYEVRKTSLQNQKEEKQGFDDSDAAKAKQMTSQPRGILKRGILKKPRESFDEKPMKEIKEGSHEIQRSSDRYQSDREGSQQGRNPIGKLNKKEGTLTESQDISAENLQKIQVIIDDFKKQYGPKWDSSAIEADLEMVLKRQLLPGLKEKLNEEQGQQLTIRSTVTPPSEHVSKVDRTLADNRDGSQKTLFPIQIPEKVSNFDGSKDFSRASTFSTIRNEENLVQSSFRKRPEHFSSVEEGERIASRIDHQGEHFERQRFRDSLQEKGRPQLIRDEALSRGIHNERQRMTVGNRQVGHQREIPLNDMRGRSGVRCQEGTPQPLLNQSGDVPGIHPERRKLLNENERFEHISHVVGKPLDISMSSLQERMVEKRFPLQDPLIRRGHEREDVRLGYGGYLVDNSFLERKQTLQKRDLKREPEERKEIIPGVADTWRDSLSERQHKLTEAGIPNSRIQGHFPEGVQLGKGQYPVGQSFKHEANIILERMQQIDDEAESSQRKTQGDFLDKRVGTQGEIISKLSQARDPSNLLSSRQFRQAEPLSAVKPPFGDLQHIYQTVHEDVARGMFYCACCQIFLGNEKDRMFHANSERHRMAVKARIMQQPFALQSAPLAGPVVAQRLALPTQPDIYDAQQIHQQSVVGHRPQINPTRLYVTPESNQPRSLWTMGPRYA